jgi:hypothetical protein
MKSQLSQPALPSPGERQRRSHHSPRLLPDSVGEASSLPVPDLWKDVLLDSRTPYYRLQRRRATFVTPQIPSKIGLEGFGRNPVGGMERMSFFNTLLVVAREGIPCDV